MSQAVFLQPLLGQTAHPARVPSQEFESPALFHTSAAVTPRPFFLSILQSVPSLYPLYSPASIHSRNWLTCTHTLSIPREHKSNFTINPLRHLASAKQRLEVSQAETLRNLASSRSPISHPEALGQPRLPSGLPACHLLLQALAQAEWGFAEQVRTGHGGLAAFRNSGKGGKQTQ